MEEKSNMTQSSKKPWFERLANETNKKYYDFLQNVRPYSPDTPLHSHHIIPKFCFDLAILKSSNPAIWEEAKQFMDSPANLILLSVKKKKRIT